MNILPQSYQTHLKSQLETSQYLLLTLLVQLLQVIKQVKLETLASNLPLPILFESRRKKIQRFLSLPQLTTWVQFMAPYAEIIAQLLHFSPHKWPYYRKGLRAMRPVQSAL
jgi:hypothetical protein